MEKDIKNKKETKDVVKKEETSPAKPKKEKKIKTVAAKKLPGMLKKTYTPEAFEKKILKRLYIEDDKKLIQSFYESSEDKKGRKILVVDKNKQIPVADVKKCKLLAKQIKQNGPAFKFVPFIAVVVLIAAIGISFTLFKNIIIEKAITASMQKIFGAKTDIAKVDFKFFGASLEILKLEQANKDEPMKNIFEIGRIHTEFELTDLLRGKIHAKELSVEDVALDTDRKKSGALLVPVKASKDDVKDVVENAEKQDAKSEKNIKAQIEEMFANYNPEKMLENMQNELKSPAVAVQISGDVQAKVDKWKDMPSKYEKSVTTLSKDIDKLVKTDYSKMSISDIKSIISTIDRTLTETNNLKNQLDTTTKDMTTDTKAITTYTNQLQAAINEDKNLVEKKISEMKSLFSVDGLNKIMNDAIQSILYKYSGKYYPYVSKIMDKALSAKNSASSKESSTKEKKQKKEKKTKTTHTRLPGRNITFKADTIPTLYIEKVIASGKEYHSNDKLFEGKAFYIANDQDKTNKPTEIKADFKVGSKPNNASVVIDARTASTSPLVLASYSGKGYSINADAYAFAFESSGNISAKLTADKTGNFLLNGALDLNMSKMTGMTFEPEKVCAIYNNALSNVRQLSIDFTVGLDDKRNIVITLNNANQIAKQLTTPITTALTAELNTIAKSASDSATKMLSEKTGIASDKIKQFTDIKSSVDSYKKQLDDMKKQLDNKKNELTKKTTEAATEKATDATKQLLKKLPF